MNTRRIALAVGAATGGTLAAAFLQTAVAFAAPVPPPSPGDTLTIFNTDTADPNPNVDTVNGIPPLFQDILGGQKFVVDDTTLLGNSTPIPVGTLDDYYSQYTFAGGDTNTEYIIDDFTANPNATNVAFTDLPGNGSVFDTFNFSNGLDNVYTDILSGSGSSATSTVSDYLTYNGTEILNLTPLVDAFAINPADFSL